jgi:tetratricopeptide (TPR) repeat protein
VLTSSKFEYDWDFAGGEAEYKKAIALDPNDATAHQWFSLDLSSIGRTKEAADEANRAYQLDPYRPSCESTKWWPTSRLADSIRPLRSAILSLPTILPLAKPMWRWQPLSGVSTNIPRQSRNSRLVLNLKLAFRSPQSHRSFPGATQS